MAKSKGWGLPPFETATFKLRSLVALQTCSCCWGLSYLKRAPTLVEARFASKVDKEGRVLSYLPFPMRPPTLPTLLGHFSSSKLEMRNTACGFHYGTSNF